MAQIPKPGQGEGRQAYIERLGGLGFEVAAFENSIPNISRGETFTPSGDYPLRPGVPGVSQTGGPQDAARLRPGDQKYPTPYEKLPTETEGQYFARLPGSRPGSPTTGVARPGIDIVAPSREDLEKKTAEIVAGGYGKNLSTDLRDAADSALSFFTPKPIPATPSLQSSLPSLQSQSGYTQAQTDLQTYQEDLRNFEATIVSEQDKIKGSVVATTVIGRRLAKLDADTAEAYREKRNAVSEAQNRLQMANMTLGQLMDAYKWDYAQAKDSYDTQFTQSIALFNAFQTATNNQQDNARANFQILYNIGKDNPSVFKDPAFQTNFDNALLQSGYSGMVGLASAIADIPLANQKLLASNWNNGVGALVFEDKGSPSGIRTVTVSGGGVVSPEEQLYSGLSSTTATALRAKVSAFKSEPTIQNFATIQDGYNFASSISGKTTNPADDQALIYSLAKALDPGSVVREGEYATAQKYAQSWVQAYGKGVTQALLGTGFLSETARENIKETIKQKYDSSKVSYDNLYSKYIGGINNLTGRKDGEKFIVDYATPEQQVGKVDNSSAILDSIVAGTPTNQPGGFWNDFLGVFGLKTK